MRPVGAITLLLVLACGGTPTTGVHPENVSPVATHPSAVPPAVPPRPAYLIAADGTHCAVDDAVWVHCTLPEGRSLSVCSSWPLGPDGTLQVREATGQATVGHPASASKRDQGWTWSFTEPVMATPGGPPPMMTGTLAGEGWSLVADELKTVWVVGDTRQECTNVQGDLLNLDNVLAP